MIAVHFCLQGICIELAMTSSLERIRSASAEPSCWGDDMANSARESCVASSCCSGGVSVSLRSRSFSAWSPSILWSRSRSAVSSLPTCRERAWFRATRFLPAASSSTCIPDLGDMSAVLCAGVAWLGSSAYSKYSDGTVRRLHHASLCCNKPA